MNAVELLEILARSTWRTLDRSHRRRVLFGEDAVTSINLNAIASLRSTVVAEDTRANEATRGCDFELWIGNDPNGWRRHAVQAKKLTVSSSRYSTLGHVVGGTKQIDILDRYAKANRAAALYCFYNYFTRAHGWNCTLPVDTEQLGCSVTPSAVVRKALAGRGRRNFSWIHRQRATLPWRCLVRCPLLAASSTAPRQPEEWPALETYQHKQLPPSLRRLREAEEPESVFGDGGAEDLFSREVDLRPGWIAVIESDA
jgi:hypothetical protein